MKKKGKEISVKRAAQALHLSERTVLNFIKQKKIEAVKVGRDWFIDHASFVSFALKYDIPISERNESVSEKFRKVPKGLTENGDFSEISEKFDSPNDSFPKFSEKNETISENFRNIPKSSENNINVSERFAGPRESSKEPATTLKRPNHVASLKVYELSRSIFSNNNFQYKPENKIEERFPSASGKMTLQF